MFYTNIWPKGNNLEAVNVDKHYIKSNYETKVKGTSLFNKYETLLNNTDFSGLWSHKFITKHMFYPEYPMINNGGIFAFRFSYLTIYAVPVFPPGTRGSMSQKPGIFKILCYRKGNKNPNSKIPTDAKHELAVIERLLLLSNSLDVLLLVPIQNVEFTNYMDLPRPISLTRKTFILHCPVLRWMYLFASFKSYRMFFGPDKLSKDVLYTLFLVNNFNLTHILNDQKYLTVDSLIHFVNRHIDLNFSTSEFMYGITIYENIREEPIYSELSSLLLPNITNLFNINFIKYPEKLQEYFYSNLHRINTDIATQEINKIKAEAYVKGKDLNPLMTIFLEFLHIWNSNETRFYEFAPMSNEILKIKAISTSVEAWNFNFLIPIYFYYGSDLIAHLKDATHYFDSIIGPYSFILSEQMDEMCSSVSFANKSITKDDAKILLISILQIYFLLTLVASYKKDSIVFDNLDEVELNELTNSSYEEYVKEMLEKLFNANISSSVILDELFFINDAIIIDPVVHKVVLCTYRLKQGLSIRDYDKIDFYDIMHMSYMMKLYYNKFYYFLQQLLKFDQLDRYIVGG